MPRVFEQGNDVTPIGSYRVASGKDDTETINSSWDKIVEWLNINLPFMKGSENLSEITNVVTARNNLDIYSTGEIKTMVDNSIEQFENLSTNDSRLELVFSGDLFGRGTVDQVYDTGIFVDSSLYIAPKYSGITLTVKKTATGAYTITHNLNIEIHHQMVVCNASINDTTVGCQSKYLKPNYMKLRFADDASANDSDCCIQFFKIV